MCQAELLDRHDTPEGESAYMTVRIARLHHYVPDVEIVYRRELLLAVCRRDVGGM